MPRSVKRIEVLGPGCARCHEAYRVVRHVVEEAGLACEVVKVESYERLAELGVMATPAVVIDGGVAIAGRIPKSDEIRRWLGVA